MEKFTKIQLPTNLTIHIITKISYIEYGSIFVDTYNLNQHNRSHNGLFMSELIYVHGISPIPNAGFRIISTHIFFRFLELRQKHVM